MGIQYFHDCESAAKESHLQEDYNPSADSHHHTADYDMGEGADAELGEGLVEVEEGYSEEGLAALLASQTSIQEEMHGRLAVKIAKHAKLFSSDSSDWKIGNRSTISNAMGDDLMKLMAWKSQMKQDVLAQNPIPVLLMHPVQLMAVMSSNYWAMMRNLTQCPMMNLKCLSSHLNHLCHLFTHPILNSINFRPDIFLAI